MLSFLIEFEKHKEIINIPENWNINNTLLTICEYISYISQNIVSAYDYWKIELKMLIDNDKSLNSSPIKCNQYVNFTILNDGDNYDNNYTAFRFELLMFLVNMITNNPLKLDKQFVSAFQKIIINNTKIPNTKTDAISIKIFTMMPDKYIEFFHSDKCPINIIYLNNYFNNVDQKAFIVKSNKTGKVHHIYELKKNKKNKN
jgi:hypothetical protein